MLKWVSVQRLELRKRDEQVGLRMKAFNTHVRPQGLLQVRGTAARWKKLAHDDGADAAVGLVPSACCRRERIWQGQKWPLVRSWVSAVV
jgi:hypothetical protein